MIAWLHDRFSEMHDLSQICYSGEGGTLVFGEENHSSVQKILQLCKVSKEFIVLVAIVLPEEVEKLNWIDRRINNVERSCRFIYVNDKLEKHRLHGQFQSITAYTSSTVDFINIFLKPEELKIAEAKKKEELKEITDEAKALLAKSSIEAKLKEFDSSLK